MNTQERSTQPVADIVASFCRSQMSFEPGAIEVDLHNDSLLVSLQKVNCPAEKNYARNKDAGDLLVKFYNELYDSVKDALEHRIGSYLERRIERSMLSINPESGDGVIFMAFVKNKKKRDSLMNGSSPDTLKARLTQENHEKLMQLPNKKLHKFVADSIELGNPDSVFICTDSAQDLDFVRRCAVDQGEEMPLNIKGHTVHFDGPQDQGRDKEVTRYLIEPGENLGEHLNTIDKREGLAEVLALLKNQMVGKRLFVRFFCLGPLDSEFSLSGVQITDSAYVCHSEDLLYRPGYEQFKRLNNSNDFFRVLHSAGRLENGVSADVANKRIYIDCHEEIVYSVNTQYAGNTVGFKKLALRLAIRKADRENWLAEHMFIMGAHGPNGRVTYFTGAFPSFCGKTSTSMIDGETIVGDDLAYLRKRNGKVFAANVECGIFGIIQNVNPVNDPAIYQSLTTPGEVIFSNILVKDGAPYWEGCERPMPESGRNFSGEWHKGKKDEQGNEIPPAHKNARYTIMLSSLANTDERADDPKGVEVGGIIYGGRDSDTWVPVQQAFDWTHGVITMGASLESETTAATIGQEGIRTFQPMSNVDFVSIPLGRYVSNHLQFVKDIKPPLIFAANYFQKGKDGCYLTDMLDKKVWLKWMELRVHDEIEAVTTPTGLMPRYEDLASLFKEHLDTGYTREQYIEQFTLRVPENLAKIDRIMKTYKTHVHDAPQVLFEVLSRQRERLQAIAAKHGDYISPFEFEKLSLEIDA